MISVIPSADRYHADHGWLETNWHFSFGDYYDPKNMNWSAAARVQRRRHPRRRRVSDASAPRHGDHHVRGRWAARAPGSPGQPRRCSAGRGAGDERRARIRHAEYNASETKPVHLMQLWVLPRHEGNQPRWEQRKFSPEQRAGKLLPVVSSGDAEGTLVIDQDATVYVSALKVGQKVTHEARGTHAYLFVIDGSITVNGKQLAKGDQARIADEKTLEISADGDAELILLDLP